MTVACSIFLFISVAATAAEKPLSNGIKTPDSRPKHETNRHRHPERETNRHRHPERETNRHRYPERETNRHRYPERGTITPCHPERSRGVYLTNPRSGSS